MRRILMCHALLSGALALELPGIPAPELLPTGRWSLRWSNDGFGPGGGARSDDFRTNQLTLQWSNPSWFMAIDHSMLTTANPTGAKIRWDLPVPGSLMDRGARRLDEATLAAGGRIRWDAGPIHTWAQGGPGILATGNLRGETIQNTAHGAIGVIPDHLPYEQQSLHYHPLVHGGAGVVWECYGPLAITAGGLADQIWHEGQRWTAEFTLLAHGSSGQWWIGLETAQAHGSTNTLTRQRTLEHEEGESIIAGWSVRIQSLDLTFASGRNLDNDAQVGHVDVAWVHAETAYQRAPGITPWYTRIGLLPWDSVVDARGFDTALGMPLGPIHAVIGYRDQELSLPFKFDVVGKRRMPWVGLGHLSSWNWSDNVGASWWNEAGIGWRRTTLDQVGYARFDEQPSWRTDAGIARIATGPSLDWRPTSNHRIGAGCLLEAAYATRQDTVTITPRNAIDQTVLIHDPVEIPVEGSGTAVVVTLVSIHNW